MDFKQIDKHTPKYYYDIYAQGFKSEDPRMITGALYGLLSAFSNDFNTLCPKLESADKQFVRSVVDYLDRKFTATVRYFRSQGLMGMIPDTGYRKSLLESRADIAAIYGASTVHGSGLILPS